MTKRKSSEELKEETTTRKTKELSTLCGIEVCMISYGANDKIKIFPEDQQRVVAMASRFIKLSEASLSKKSTSLEHVLKDIEKMKMTVKRQKKEEKVVDVDPNVGSKFDLYSIDELKVKLESIRRNIQSINEWRENMNKINYRNFDSVVQSVEAIGKEPSTPVQISEREEIFLFGAMACNQFFCLGHKLIPAQETTVCQKIRNSYDSQNYQTKKRKIDHRNITSSPASSSSTSSPTLGFENRKQKDYGNKASSSSVSAAEPSFPKDLVFGSNNNNNYNNNIFDDIVEDDKFTLLRDFGFIDLKEVDNILEDFLLAIYVK